MNVFNFLYYASLVSWMKKVCVLAETKLNMKSQLKILAEFNEK